MALHLATRPFLRRQLIRQCGSNVKRRFQSNKSTSIHPSPTEHKVVHDGRTLYIEQDLAEALGWTPEQGPEGLRLTLHGWAPSYFSVTPQGSDSGESTYVSSVYVEFIICPERLASGTIESSRNLRVHAVLDYLKDR